MYLKFYGEVTRLSQFMFYFISGCNTVITARTVSSYSKPYKFVNIFLMKIKINVSIWHRDLGSCSLDKTIHNHTFPWSMNNVFWIHSGFNKFVFISTRTTKWNTSHWFCLILVFPIWFKFILRHTFPGVSFAISVFEINEKILGTLIVSK